MTLLAGRVALVTGASRGIGAAVAIELARRGAHLVLTARTQGGLEETDDAIRATGGTATLLPLDLVKQQDQIDAIGPSLYERFGRLDIVVHAAGAINRLTPVAHIEPGDWNQVLGVTLSAAWRLIRSCDPPLRASDAGRAVFLTDARARTPTAYWGMYGAAKAGLDHLVLSWAAETTGTRLRVNLFAPPPTATKLHALAFPGIPPESLAQPADVAVAVADLCGPGETRTGLTLSGHA
ncbi:SDR family NAD(P)-dependent oxidoreductase [Plastoroseomonas arctica]|uniref:SDR family oxidoreductase n=1 Tax=Plastoroseomonas arctica TaxID=1509237 RepID=A0AAF1JWF2_9PROT|nr:SDR family oxidoreductase [Plastoroseomonas arctica]MBR0655204.1 SDR family oxidoreductase [Plastoroseomonas arctica]